MRDGVARVESADRRRGEAVKLRSGERLTLAEAESRALAALDFKELSGAADIARRIWPGNMMKAQGAGAAASRILVGLKKRGMVEWRVSRSGSWGWRKLAAGGIE
jgi:hypothetical protein